MATDQELRELLEQGVELHRLTVELQLASLSGRPLQPILTAMEAALDQRDAWLKEHLAETNR